MRAGELRHRVIIQQKYVTQDAEGITTESWADIATVWAAIEPLRGREFFDAAAVNAEVTTRIRIRYRSGIVPAMRVVYGSQVYEIESVIDVGGRRRELELLCKG